MDWHALAGELDQEEDDIEEDKTAPTPYTHDLKASLQGDGYSWEDWLNIRSIADAASTSFPIGKKFSAREALLALD